MKDDIIYGRKPVFEAIETGRQIEKILVAKGSAYYPELRKAIGPRRIHIQTVPEEKLNRITRKNHQGVVAYVGYVDYQDLDNVLASVYEAGQIPLFLALDGVTDVGNFGAIARSALCFGAQAIIVPEKGSALINGVAVKASAGAIQRINICKVSYLKDSLQELQANGLQLVATTLSDTAKPIEQIDFTVPTCIVLGNEEKGVGEHIIDQADAQAYIPMQANFDSLNVSVAGGVILYESQRQRLLLSE